MSRVARRVQLSFWQHPFVQNVMPFLTSLVLHAHPEPASRPYKTVQAVAIRVRKAITPTPP